MPSVAWRPDLSEKKPDRCSHTGPAVPPWWGSTKVARSLRSKVFSLATARWLLKVLCLLRVPIWLCDFVVCIILCRFQTCSLDIFMDLKPLRPQVSLARTKKKWSSKHLWLHMATSRMACGGVWFKRLEGEEYHEKSSLIDPNNMFLLETKIIPENWCLEDFSGAMLVFTDCNWRFSYRFVRSDAMVTVTRNGCKIWRQKCNAVSVGGPFHLFHHQPLTAPWAKMAVRSWLSESCKWVRSGPQDWEQERLTIK